MSTTPSPLHRLDADTREAQARRFTGQIVCVTYSALRSTDDHEATVGELLGVARPLTGAGTNTRSIVVHTVTGELVTISLATVVTIANPDADTYAAAVARHGQNA